MGDIVKKSLIYATGVVIVALILVATITMVTNEMNEENNKEFPGDPKYDYIEYTDKNIYLLGKSQWTDTIIETLKKSTSNITQTLVIKDMENITEDSLLMIDGYWLDRPDVSIQQFVSSVNVALMNEVPVLMIGQTPNLLYAAIDGYTTIGKDSSTSVANNTYSYPNTTGLYLDVEKGVLDTYTSSEPYTKYGIEYKTTVLYNWGVTKLQ